MSFFIYNIGFFLYAFASLYFAGLGLSLVFLPKYQQRYVFLIAPLMGICFLTLVGLFQIAVLLVPFTPRANISVLLLVSLLICLVFCRQNLQSAWEKFRSTSISLWLLPILLIFVFAWMFHNEGLHLLVGSSDQLQYCENARQILEKMHTGSLQDVPVARQEYFVYEAITRTLPYTKDYRRGAELVLATITAITGLSYQAAFPVTVLCALLTLGLTIGLIGRLFLRLSYFYTLALQLIFLSGFYFWLLHIQGSLAMIVGVPTGLTTLAFLSAITSNSTWRKLALTAIITAAYFSIYPEPAFVNILLPTLALLLWRLSRDKSSFLLMLRNVILLYLFVFILAPVAVHTVFVTTTANFKLLLMPYLNASTAAGVSAIPVARNFLPQFSMQTWEVAGAVLGLMSYYNTGSFHHTMKFLFINHPGAAFIGFMLFSGCGLLGYIKAKNILARLLCIPMVGWVLAAFVAANQHDDFRFARSLHYALPFTMIGMVLLASQYSRPRGVIFNLRNGSWLFTLTAPRQNSGVTFAVCWQNSIKILSRIVLVTFIFMNIYTTFRTVRFVASHDNGNDPVLLRFDERNSQWQLLKKELEYSASRHVPVLISGFQETVRPLAISIIMRNQKHVLGDGVLRLWRLYDATEPEKFAALSQGSMHSIENIYKCGAEWVNGGYAVFRPYISIVSNVLRTYNHFLTYQRTTDYLAWSRYNTRFQASEMLPFQHRENKPWYKVEAGLVRSSEQAVVSFNNNYPEEWLSNRDVFPPLVKNFPNICKVIYRHQYAVVLPKQMVASLARDAKGLFRIISSSGPIIINDKATTSQILTLDYDGNIGDVKLHVGNKLYIGEKIGLDDHVRIVTTVHPCNNPLLNLDVANPVKIRSISWDPATS